MKVTHAKIEAPVVMDFAAGDVVSNFNARTAIIVATGRTKVHYVPIEEGELVVRSEDVRIFEYTTILRGYPLKRAVRSYLRHNGGVSKKARDALKQLLEAS